MLSVCLFRAILSSNSRNSCASITVSLCLLGAKTYCHTTRKTDQNSKLESCIDASNATPQEKKRSGDNNSERTSVPSQQLRSPSSREVESFLMPWRGWWQWSPCGLSPCPWSFWNVEYVECVPTSCPWTDAVHKGPAPITASGGVGGQVLQWPPSVALGSPLHLFRPQPPRSSLAPNR